MNTALIIDDDSPNLRLLSTMLNRFGYDVHMSQRGDHGVELAQQIHPDLIMVDLLMPKSTYDGLETVQMLRRLPQFQITPIIAISAADAKTIEMMMSQGLFTDYLQKPITLDKLNLLFNHLEQRSA